MACDRSEVAWDELPSMAAAEPLVLRYGAMAPARRRFAGDTFRIARA
jgi:hypothetical protein